MTEISPSERPTPARRDDLPFHPQWNARRRFSPRLVDRVEWLKALCKGRRVLDLGCAAAPDTIALMNAGTLLYSQLAETAASVVGLDRAPQALAILQQRYPAATFVCCDVEHLKDRTDIPTPEVIVAAEILEHLSNPGLFLDQVHSVMAPDTVLAVTTVNALSTLAGIRALFGEELVHPEHTAYYSLKTLVQLLERHGFQVTEVAFYSFRSWFALRRIAAFPFDLWLKFVNPSGATNLIAKAQIR